MPLSQPMSVHTVEMVQAQASVLNTITHMRRGIEDQPVTPRLPGIQ